MTEARVDVTSEYLSTLTGDLFDPCKCGEGKTSRNGLHAENLTPLAINIVRSFDSVEMGGT